MARVQKFALRTRTTLPATATHPAAAIPVPPTPPAADPIAAAMDQAATDMPRLLTPEEVAAMLGLTERTLERWRITGEGPRFAKLSRSTVRYLRDDVAAFVADRMRANTVQ